MPRRHGLKDDERLLDYDRSFVPVRQPDGLVCGEDGTRSFLTIEIPALKRWAIVSGRRRRR